MARRADFFFRPQHPYTVMLMAAFSYNQRLRALWRRPQAGPDVRGSGAGGCAYFASHALGGRRIDIHHADQIAVRQLGVFLRVEATQIACADDGGSDFLHVAVIMPFEDQSIDGPTRRASQLR